MFEEKKQDCEFKEEIKDFKQEMETMKRELIKAIRAAQSKNCRPNRKGYYGSMAGQWNQLNTRIINNFE